MGFWQKFRTGAQRYMQGRHGADQLNNALTLSGLVLYVITLFINIPVLWLISLVILSFALFRTFSKNNEKRWQENRKYVELSTRCRTSITQAINRLRNSKKYKYFKCPNCKAWLKLPRNVGKVTITCGKCSNAFRKKA